MLVTPNRFRDASVSQSPACVRDSCPTATVPGPISSSLRSHDRQKRGDVPEVLTGAMSITLSRPWRARSAKLSSDIGCPRLRREALCQTGANADTFFVGQSVWRSGGGVSACQNFDRGLRCLPIQMPPIAITTGTQLRTTADPSPRARPPCREAVPRSAVIDRQSVARVPSAALRQSATLCGSKSACGMPRFRSGREPHAPIRRNSSRSSATAQAWRSDAGSKIERKAARSITRSLSLKLSLSPRCRIE